MNDSDKHLNIKLAYVAVFIKHPSVAAILFHTAEYRVLTPFSFTLLFSLAACVIMAIKSSKSFGCFTLLGNCCKSLVCRRWKTGSLCSTTIYMNNKSNIEG